MSRKVLHIIPFGIFLDNYRKAFENDYEYSHLFWAYGYSNRVQEERNIQYKFSNVLIDEDYGESLAKYYSKCDYVVIQSIPEKVWLLRTIITCQELFNKKSIVIPWGRDADKTSDIYNIINEESKEIDRLKALFLKKIHLIGCTNILYRNLVENYNVNIENYFFGNMLAAYSNQDIPVTVVDVDSHNYNVMVGHRGTYTSRHMSVFQILAQYQANINRIICPLVYGNKACVEDVKKVGESVFGEKFISIDGWMSKRLYYEYLCKNIHVGIFTTIAEGATTIYALAAMGKTLYLNEQSESYEILNLIGIKVFEISRLYAKGIELIDKDERMKNMEIMSEFGRPDRFIKKWHDVLYKLG